MPCAKLPEINQEKFYGRRKGKKLRPNRVRLLEDVLPRYQIRAGQALPSGHRDLWLEVGFGAGEHLAAQAAAHPDVLMIGCEPFINGVAKLCEHIEQGNLTNIRILNDDARPLLDALPDSCLDRVFVLFADPWPKTRHADRRFIGKANLDRLARLMKPGAELRVASDHPILKRWSLQQLRAHPAFKWRLEKCHDWLHRPTDWPPTRYEQKALHGRPHFYTFVRI
jgi:tRNA (guanine-N7-)-methyltransferase